MTDVKAFERGFVATSFLLGRREELVSGLSEPSHDAKEFARHLLAPDRAERAKRLAAALRSIVSAVVALDVRKR